MADPGAGEHHEEQDAKEDIFTDGDAFGGKNGFAAYPEEQQKDRAEHAAPECIIAVERADKYAECIPKRFSGAELLEVECFDN